MRTSNSLISLTLFRWYASIFFVQNSRGISRVPSPWSLRHGILQLKWHSRVTCGIVLTILGSVVRQKPVTIIMGAMEVEMVAMIMVLWKGMDLMATDIWILQNGAMRLSRTEKAGLFLIRTTFWMQPQAGYNLKGELSLLCYKPNHLGVLGSHPRPPVCPSSVIHVGPCAHPCWPAIFVPTTCSPSTFQF